MLHQCIYMSIYHILPNIWSGHIFNLMQTDSEKKKNTPKLILLGLSARLNMNSERLNMN